METYETLNIFVNTFYSSVCLSIHLLYGPISGRIFGRQILGTLHRVCFIPSITVIKLGGLVGYFFYHLVLLHFLSMEI